MVDFNSQDGMSERGPTFYGEMTVDGGAPVTPDAANVFHLSSGTLGTGAVNGFTYTAGDTAAITAYATHSGGAATLVTSGTHGLPATGTIVVNITDSTNYNGVHLATYVDADSFTIPVAFAGDDGASNWRRADRLTAGIGAAGEYMIVGSMSVTKAVGVSSTLTIEAYINATVQPHVKTIRVLSTADTGAMPVSGTVAVADGDQITLGWSLTSTNTLTPNVVSFVLYRL
jgi:hypothetical protein